MGSRPVNLRSLTRGEPVPIIPAMKTILCFGDSNVGEEGPGGRPVKEILE